ncbi:MAG: 30S ribosome-binding factor RbfA [Methylobacillus sp.]|jgi:ribosome-binding factor A|nr:30S ribosome-binding factor RbfA [Methylobacillus sp.]
MAKEFARSQRIAEQIQRELADLLQFELKDPRVTRVTVTEVEVSGDLAHAKVFYSAAEGSPELQKGLEKAAGFLRSQLSQRMLMRTVPQLHFVYDASIERGMALSRLIDDAVAKDQKRGADDAHES